MQEARYSQYNLIEKTYASGESRSHELPWKNKSQKSTWAEILALFLSEKKSNCLWSIDFFSIFVIKFIVRVNFYVKYLLTINLIATV